MALTATVFTPAYRLDLSSVGREGEDYRPGDLAEVLAQPRVNDAFLSLFKRAGSIPTLCFACTAVHLRVVAGAARASGLKATHVDDFGNVAECRERVDELIHSRLDVLVSCRRLTGMSPIPGLRSVALLRPTLDPNLYLRTIARLAASPSAVILDLAENTHRHGLWRGVAPDTIVVDDPELIVRDPMVNRIDTAPFRNVMQWAKGNTARLELVQRVKGFKDGWTYHAIKATDPQLAERWWGSRPRNGEIPTRGGSAARRRAQPTGSERSRPASALYS